MFVALQKSPSTPTKFRSYHYEKRKRKKDVFKFFGVPTPKEFLRKTRRTENMVVRRKSSSRSVKRGGSFKEENYGQPVIFDVVRKFLYLVLHLLVVVGVLLAAALVFTKFEDQPLSKENVLTQNSSSLEIWSSIELKYNINISHKDRQLIAKELNNAVLPRKEKTMKFTRFEVFKKWFYFASIASTTIGEEFRSVSSLRENY